MMSDERRAEIETMLEAITPGKWQWADAYMLEAVDRDPDEVEQQHSHWRDVSMNILHGARQSENRRFIAAAPAIIRELLSEVDRLAARQANT